MVRPFCVGRIAALLLCEWQQKEENSTSRFLFHGQLGSGNVASFRSKGHVRCRHSRSSRMRIPVPSALDPLCDREIIMVALSAAFGKPKLRSDETVSKENTIIFDIF